MFDKFGEFDSAEKLNHKAEELLKTGDTGAILALAAENGLDKEDAKDYIDGCVDTLATPLLAAVGKLKVESEDLDIKGIAEDWKSCIAELCAEDEKLCAAVRRKGKELKLCMASLIEFSFENKVQISNKIMKNVKVVHNGKKEAFRGPLYMGVPNNVEVKKLIRAYYLGEKK